MNIIKTTLVVLGFAFALSACNTTEALTPQVDVGGGAAARSTPVTQEDATRMAALPQAEASGQQQSDADASAQQLNQPQRNFSAQNTLQAQAEALSRGNRQGESQTLRQPSRQAEGLQASAPAAGAGNGTIRFLPIIGAPVQAVTPLSRQLGSEARARGLTIKGATDTSSEHILKGYLSAFGDGSTVTVVYVWDVLDNAGARLHRIQGQESLRASAADPWAAVPASVMQQIATKTMDQYMSWRQGNRG